MRLLIYLIRLEKIHFNKSSANETRISNVYRSRYVQLIAKTFQAEREKKGKANFTDDSMFFNGGGGSRARAGQDRFLKVKIHFAKYGARSVVPALTAREATL